MYGPKGDSLIRQYRIFYADDGDTIFHHSDLQFIHKSPQQAYFFISRKNRIDVFGFNNSTDGKYSLGFYHDQYDIVTGKQISRETKNFMLDAPDTAINLFLKDFYITNAFDRKSGLYVFAERATYNPKLYRYNIIRNPVYHQFNIDEGLVIHFSTENKLDWIQMVPKKQVFSSSYNTAASFESVIGKNALLVYNDNPRNHDLKDGEIPRSYHSDDATEIVMVSINDESMERFALVPQKNNNYHYFIPDKAAIINEKKIFLITESGGDYRFGTIEFK